MLVNIFPKRKVKQMTKSNFNYKKLLLSIGIGLVLSFAVYYIVLPPINPHSKSFWIYLAFCIFSYTIPYIGFKVVKIQKKAPKGRGYFNTLTVQAKNDGKAKFFVVGAILLPVAIAILGSIFSSTFFFAKKYASIIDVTESEFKTDMPETHEITNIALMDTSSASMLGNRELGALSHVVSQYDLSDYYTQINYHGTPQKVANLEYDGFFKWINNCKSGIPGMVMVDPVKSDADYIEFENPMFYADSAYFSQDLTRKLRFDYPTKIFHNISFEVDESGNPYYIVSCATAKISLFGAMDINEVIVFDPTTGESELYAVEDVPAWIDIVYDGYLASEKYNWQGTLSGGFINSIIGNKGCKITTDDFGYIARDDDVWYFTGVTSVSGDKSNIGFILSNARTGEYKFYPVIGAEEHSAMSAAEGEVQEKGYVSSFPSLVNISGQATYIMVLKDNAGLVKLYALVNVENYSIVATGSTQAEAMSSYKKLLTQNNLVAGDSDSEVEITVENVRIAMVADVATLYITDTDGNVYKGYLEADEELILIRTGDRIKVKCTSSEHNKIFIISSWSFAE